MKKRVFGFIFFLVMLSLASNIAAGVIMSGAKIEITEKEGKEVDHESEFEKDKIFQNYTFSFGLLSFLKMKHLHPTLKISIPVLGTEINPPDGQTA